MRGEAILRLFAAFLVVLAVLPAAPARAVEQVTVGTGGHAS